MQFGMRVVFGLAVAASSAFAQFSSVSSREALNANDMVTWNQFGPGPNRLPLPQTATSLLGAQVTVDSDIDPKIRVSTAGIRGERRDSRDGQHLPVSLSFNPPVIGVARNT